MVLSERDFLLSSSSKGSQSDWCGFTEHSVNYLTLGGYADSTSQMSVVGRELHLKEGLTVIEKFTASALHVKGGHPFSACICCRYDAYNSLLPHLSKPILAAGALCLYSTAPLPSGHHKLQGLAQGGPACLGPRMKARPVDASLPPQLPPPDLPLFHFVVRWLPLCTNNQHSFLEECPFIISLRWSHKMVGCHPSCEFISCEEYILKKHLFIMPSAGIEIYVGWPDKLLRFYSINCADRKAEPQSNHSI